MLDPRPRRLDAVAAQRARAVGDVRGQAVPEAREARRCSKCCVIGKPILRFRRVDGGERWLCPRCKVELESRRAGAASASASAGEPGVPRRAS